MCSLMCEAALYAHTPDDSKAIERRSGPMIVISAGKMATGGWDVVVPGMGECFAFD
jgi:hypothetical protein